MGERSVTYVEPDVKLIRTLAHSVNEHFAQDDKDFDCPDVSNGLADFLVLLAQLAVKNLNEGRYELLDTENR